MDELTKARSTRFQGRIVLGRYRINSRLAQGGMSSIYLARDMNEGGLYAVKVLREDLVLEPRIGQRFINESQAIARINHPAIVRIYDVGKTGDDRICLVMEYIDGVALRRRISRGPVPMEEAVPILSAIADGLETAHRNSVIHRDLKPENILLPRKSPLDTPVKIIDFGIARIIDTPRITTNQRIMGTPLYLAPEQALDAPLDHRADIYALGVIAYEMFAGKPPFDGADPEALLDQHIRATPPPLHSHRSGAPIPRALNDLVMACLSKSPEERPDSMGAFLSVLRRL